MTPRPSLRGGRSSARHDGVAEVPARWSDSSWHQGLSNDALLATPGMAHTGDDALSALPMTEHLLDRLRAAGL